MQEFLTNNTVNCNLMSLTGYRTLVILSALMESPKSNAEINDCLLNNQYIKEKFSSDTLRIYINSLRAIGCEITQANRSSNKKYKLISHPFAYNIQKPQIKALAKLYKNSYEKLDIREIMAIENFFNKLSESMQDESTKEQLKNISVLKQIDREILNNLVTHCKNQNQITFLYNSPKSGPKEIELIADKLSFKSEKLYLWGKNLTHKQYSYFALERIIKICSIKFSKTHEKFPVTRVIYELKGNPEYIPEPDEKILERNSDKLKIQLTSENEFSLIQRILSMADDCRVIEPETFKTKITEKLRKMEEAYDKI